MSQKPQESKSRTGRVKHAEKLYAFQMPKGLRETIYSLTNEINDGKHFGREIFPYEVVRQCVDLVDDKLKEKIKESSYDEMDLLKIEFASRDKDQIFQTFSQWLLERHKKCTELEQKNHRGKRRAAKEPVASEKNE